MTNEKVIRLLKRQLTDIQIQAEKIVAGDNSAAAIENFARYSSDLKDYIERYVSDEEVRACAENIYDLNYSRVHFRLWEFLVLPLYWTMLVRDYYIRRQLTQQVNGLRGRYASLEFRVWEMEQKELVL